MVVYVLYWYWDTPDNGGNEIIGVYRKFEDAKRDMLTDSASTKERYPDDFWSADMTWANRSEIHLGYDPMSFYPATSYCWRIVMMEVK